MEALKYINLAISILFFLCYSYQLIYLFIPLLKKDKPHKPEKQHRYAVLIAARNEAPVVGNLIDSIWTQDYPSELITVFVVADNCTDNTAELARRHGALVFERFDKRNVGKGYALDFLLKQIRRGFGEDAFDGYFVFDADNLLKSDYIAQMNRTFSDGFQIVTSYRNSKNFGDNWISAGYALWFLRESEFLNHARMLIGTSAAVSGTGFLFSAEVLKKCGGWSFFLLTEDIEFTIHNITGGERIGYCPQAVLYDEQPVKFTQSWRQRMRWAKGYLQVFGKYGGRLMRGIFKRNGFACYDMSMAIMPAIILASAGFAVNTAASILGIAGGAKVAGYIFMALRSLAGTYLFMLFIGAVTTATQWKNIHTSNARKILYTFTFPLFMFTYIPISISAMFKRVEWKPIEHKVSVSISEIERKAV
ncbi:MAG: glycosyltransferase family 2 protein [Oscillospiraceae bacterium]